MRYNLNNIDVEAAFPDGSREHCTIYTDLRQVVSEHILNGNSMPQLSLCVAPTGGRAWQPVEQPIEAFVRNNAVKADDQDMDIAEEEGDIEDDLPTEFAELT